jgi:hypothetical protein
MRADMDFLRKLIPGSFKRYLEGIEFPIDKQELIGRLERNGAPGTVVDQIRKRLPEGQYSGVQELIKRLRG